MYGVRKDCKECRYAYKKEWIKNNPEKRSAQKSRNYYKHKETKQAKNKKWVEENQNHIKAYRKRTYAAQDKNTPEYRYAKLYHSVKKRPHFPLLFNLQEFINWHNSREYKCEYCGDFIKGTSYQLDRIDPKKGYELENIVNCCRYCNAAKLNLSLHDFKEHITKIFKRFNDNEDRQEEDSKS